MYLNFNTDHKRTHGDKMKYLLGLVLLQVCLAYNYDRYRNSGMVWRGHTGIISVNNGGIWGEWREAQFCPLNTFAVGYSLKVQTQKIHIFNKIKKSCKKSIALNTLSSWIVLGSDRASAGTFWYQMVAFSIVMQSRRTCQLKLWKVN